MVPRQRNENKWIVLSIRGKRPFITMPRTRGGSATSADRQAASPRTEDRRKEVRREYTLAADTKAVEVRVEVIKEVPVEHIVVKEVPVYVDRVVESDRVVTAVKEVPVDRIVINEVAVPVDRIVTNEVEKIVEVVKQVSVRSVVEVVKEVDSPALVDELETCKRQRDELRKERHELEQQRDQVR